MVEASLTSTVTVWLPSSLAKRARTGDGAAGAPGPAATTFVHRITVGSRHVGSRAAMFHSTSIAVQPRDHSI